MLTAAPVSHRMGTIWSQERDGSAPWTGVSSGAGLSVTAGAEPPPVAARAPGAVWTLAGSKVVFWAVVQGDWSRVGASWGRGLRLNPGRPTGRMSRRRTSSHR